MGNIHIYKLAGMYVILNWPMEYQYKEFNKRKSNYL